MRSFIIAAGAALAFAAAGPGFAYQTGGSGHNVTASVHQTGAHGAGGGGGAGKVTMAAHKPPPLHCQSGKPCPRRP